MNEKIFINNKKPNQFINNIGKKWLSRLNQSFVNDFEYNDDEIEFQLEKINQAFLLNFNHYQNQAQYELLVGSDYRKNIYFVGKIISRIIDYDEIIMISSETPNLTNGVWPYINFSIVTKKTKQIIDKEAKLWL